jgi:hypothetical protein
MSLLLAFAALAPAAAYQSLVWRDYFDDNSNNWYVGDSADDRCEIKDGVYRLTGKTGGIWVSYGLEINRNADYSLEAKVRGDSTTDSNYTGLIWDMKDEKNYYQFVVSTRGKFAVQRSVDKKFANIVEWTASPAIVTGGYNILKVRRMGSYLVFSINGTEVKTLAHEGFLGDYIGLVFYGAQTMTVDHVSLEEEKVYEGEPFPLLKDVLQAWYTTQFPAGSAPWLESQGKLSGSWDRLSAAGPGYVLEHATRESTDYLAEDISTDLTYDFAVVAKVKLLSGDLDIDYGIALDVDGQDFLKFGVSGNGSFIIARYTAGKYIQIVPWTKNANVNLYESFNTLEVMRRDSRLIFGINEHTVYEMAYDHWTSPKAGFYSHGKMKLRPLALTSYQILRRKGLVFGDVAEGFAAWQYEDGSRYIGFWKGGKRNGRGALYRPDGTVAEGLWKDDAYAGAWVRPGPFHYPVQKRFGEIGLVDSRGAEKGFGLQGFLNLGEPVAGPLPVAEGKKIGFLDASGALKRSSDWSLASSFSGGVALVKGSAGVGLVDASGKLLAAPGKYQIDAGQDFSTGAIIVRKAKDPSLYGLLDLKGQELRAPELLSIAPFSGGLAAAKARNGLYGFIDLAGDWRVPPRYVKVGDFHEGLAFAMPSKVTRRFIDAKGKTAFDIAADREIPAPYRFSEGKLWYYKPGSAAQGFLNRAGAEAFPASTDWSSASLFAEGRALVSSGPRRGFIDAKGAFAVELRLQDARPFSSGLAAAKFDDFWGFIDPAGNWAIPPTYLDAFPFADGGLAQVQLKDGSWTWIDSSGDVIWTDPTDPAIILENDFLDEAEPWPLGENESIKMALTQGYYYIKAKQATGGLAAAQIELDRGLDYSFSARVRYNSTSMSENIGLAWDIVDIQNFYALVISPQGGYAVVHFKAGQPVFLIPWTASESITKSMADNDLEVKRAGDSLEFTANGMPLATLPYESIDGGWLGFACFGGTSLIVDSLTVRKGF